MIISNIAEKTTENMFIFFVTFLKTVSTTVAPPAVLIFWFVIIVLEEFPQCQLGSLLLVRFLTFKNCCITMWLIDLDS